MDYTNRQAREAQLARAIARLGTRQQRELFRIMGNPPKLENLPPEYWGDKFTEWQGVLTPELEDIFVDSAREMMLDPTFGGPMVSWDLINTDASNWARRYGYDLVTDINDNTRDGLQRAVADFYDQGLNMQQLRRKLSRWYGPVRADMIATTEVTRASVQGELAVADELRKEGIEMVAIWNTNNDEIVCGICGPLNQKPRGVLWQDPPPAHPNCRCWLSHELPKVEAVTVQLEEQQQHIVEDHGAGEARGQLAEMYKTAEDLYSEHEAIMYKINKTTDLYVENLNSGRMNMSEFGERMKVLEKEKQRALDSLKRSREIRANMRELVYQPVTERNWHNRNNISNDSLKSRVEQGFDIWEKMIGSSDLENSVAGTYIEFDDTTSARSFYSGLGGVGISSNCSVSTTVHELGHHLEASNIDAKRAVTAFYDRRTAGSPLEKLLDVAPGAYDENEVTRVDDFFIPYMGKDYGERNKEGLMKSSEILSMGMEYLYKSPGMFAAKDPEYFDFIYNLLRSL